MLCYHSRTSGLRKSVERTAAPLVRSTQGGRSGVPRAHSTVPVGGGRSTLPLVTSPRHAASGSFANARHVRQNRSERLSMAAVTAQLRFAQRIVPAGGRHLPLAQSDAAF